MLYDSFAAKERDLMDILNKQAKLPYEWSKRFDMLETILRAKAAQMRLEARNA